MSANSFAFNVFADNARYFAFFCFGGTVVQVAYLVKGVVLSADVNGPPAVEVPVNGTGFARGCRCLLLLAGRSWSGSLF